MSKHAPNRALVVLALSFLAAMVPALGYTDESDGPAEKAGEKIDETVDRLREGAKKGLKKAGEALEKTGEAVSEGAQEAAESVDGDGE